MSPPAVALEVLPAGFGDCLLVSCPVGRSTWRMLVDTGPDETYLTLRRRLLQIPGFRRQAAHRPVRRQPHRPRPSAARGFCSATMSSA
ncbi:MAG: hypothetical protein IPN37_08790 [Betaproteobacteria bacterium]|nr:hypothetical protein [Betaproteobacteria bacterium]